MKRDQHEATRTGWPPGLLQDDSKPLSRWFAGRPNARQEARLAAAIITNKTNTSATAEPIAVVDFYADEKERRC